VSWKLHALALEQERRAVEVSQDRGAALQWGRDRQLVQREQLRELALEDRASGAGESRPGASPDRLRLEPLA